MNPDEIGSAVRKIAVAILSAYAANHAASVSASDIQFWGSVAADIAVFAWGVYAHWNMKKVPETATIK